MSFVAGRENSGLRATKAMLDKLEDEALSEKLAPFFDVKPWTGEDVRALVASGQAVIPANVRHREAEPTVIGEKIPHQGERESRDDREDFQSGCGTRKAARSASLRRRHGDGSLGRRGFGTHPPRDAAPQSRAARNRADLRGAREGEKARGPSRGTPSTKRSANRRKRASTT